MLTFERRYLFQGDLVFTTALHIGGGNATLSPSQSPVLLGPDREPFIPGSSLKGAFRSTVEKLAPALGLKTCALTGETDCPGSYGEAFKEFNKEREEKQWKEAQWLAQLDEELCDTCKLFGSQFHASRILFDDLPGIAWAGATEIRDGVGIDRDSERARDRLKYDFEVVPAGAVFALSVTLEEPTDTDLLLACVGFSEFVSGMAGLGGKRSRGLGRCELRELRIYRLDLRDPSQRAKRLASYLVGKTPKEKMDLVPDAHAFLREEIEQGLKGGSRC